MKLREFRERSLRVLLVQFGLAHIDEMRLGAVEVGGEGVPSVEYTIRPRADGGFEGLQWYWEAGGGRPIARVAADTEESALDWVWFMAASEYRKAYVRPAREQRDFVYRSVGARMAAGAATPGAREMFARHTEEPWEDASEDPEALARAAVSAEGLSAMRIARNPCTPAATLHGLVLDGPAAARWQVAGNPSTAPATLDLLRKSADFGVRWYLAARSGWPIDDLVAWTAEDPALWPVTAARPDCPPSALRDIDQASSGTLRAQLAQNPALDPDDLLRFADEADSATAIAMLESEGLPVAARGRLLDVLARGSDGLAGHRLRLDGEMVNALVRSGDAARRRLAAAAVDLPADAVVALADDADPGVRRVIAARADLPVAVQRRLAVDPAWGVRWGIRVNWGIDGEIRRLAEDAPPER